MNTFPKVQSETSPLMIPLHNRPLTCKVWVFDVAEPA